MLDFSIVLGAFQRISLDIIRNLSVTVENVMYFLAIIDLILSMFYDKNEDLNIFWTLFKKVLLYGFFVYLLKNYTYIVEVIERGFIQLGNVATGNGRGTSLIDNPGVIFTDTVSMLLGPAILSGGASVVMDLAGIESIPTAILMTTLGIGLTAGATSLTIIFVFVKFYLTSAVTILTLAFGVFSKSKDIAMKRLVGLFSQGIELTLTVIIFNFVTTFYSKYISGSLEGSKSDPVGLLNVLIIVLFFFLLINRIPAMVATILSGSISSLSIGSGVGKMGMKALSDGGKTAVSSAKNAYESYKNATANK